MDFVIMTYYQVAGRPWAGITFPLKNANPLLIVLKMTIIIHGTILLTLNTVEMDSLIHGKNGMIVMKEQCKVYVTPYGKIGRIVMEFGIFIMI